MLQQTLDDLSFSRFTAHFLVRKTAELPFYPGSTLRGALGHALRRVRYGLNPEICPDCPVRSECRYGSLYDYFFESPADHPFLGEVVKSLSMKHATYPQPFVLDPPEGGRYLPGRHLTLPFTLVGKAIECFPFMACALSLMGLGRLGRSEGSVQLEAVVDGFPSGGGSETLIYDGRTGRIEGPAQVLNFNLVRQWMLDAMSSGGSAVRKMQVRFLTPFRYRNENRLGDALTFKLFLRNVLRRLTLLSVHSPLSFPIDFQVLLAEAEGVETETSSLHWFDWERYSARQKGRMKLGGFVGEIVFSGSLDGFLPYLKLCEFLNVGKNVAFGLGKYQVALPG